MKGYYETLEHVTVLGDGTFTGKLAGHNFEYHGKHYYSEIGIRTPFPTPYTITIKNGKEVL